MSKQYDATTKRLVEMQPEAWLRLALGAGQETPLPPVRVINTDVSTVTAAVDHVLRVEADEPFLVHLEFESRYHPENPKRLRFYNVQLNYGQNLHVRTVLPLLRRGADGPTLTGRITEGSEGEEDLLAFHYRVIRLHEMNPEPLLTGDLGTLPLAPLAAVPARELPAVVQQVEERLAREAEPDRAQDLWAATYILLGLNYGKTFISELMKGIRKMKDSTTYRAILAEGKAEGKAEGRVEGKAEGRAEEARSLLLRLGAKRLGKPDETVQAHLATVADVDELERLIERLLEVENWAELLQ